MNELDILSVINNELSFTEFIGNDCAELTQHDFSKSLYVTHDTLVEGVHFSLDTISPYQLGVKSVLVNISDLCAALAQPTYLSISLSMPKDVSASFVVDFYKGINAACKRFGCFVSGGDLTRSEKVIISICAIGQQSTSVEVGRDKAEEGDAVVLCGYAGSSAIGLLELQENHLAKTQYTMAHLNPEIGFGAALKLSLLSPKSLATMDTSDGLADAIYKISKASGKVIHIDGDKIPVMKGFSERCKHFGVDENYIKLFGAEDFALLFTIKPEYLEKLENIDYTVIGKVCGANSSPISVVKFAGKDDILLTEDLIKKQTFHHFSDNSTKEGDNV